jgi:hypothetical protein
MRLLNELGRALADAGSMTWQITWSLILGFTLSAVIQAVVRREAIAGTGQPQHQNAGAGHRPGCRLLVVLVRRGGAGPCPGPPGRQLHRRDGL